MSGQIAGRVAVVTGASSGIGQASAIALAAAGATVVAVARRADRLAQTVDTITAAGGQAIALIGDVADENVARVLVEETVTRFGRLDILVNAAGVIQSGNVGDADIAQWRRVLDINLMATLYMCHAALGPMRTQGSGNIINVGSLACRTTSPTFNPYTTSKFAVNALTDALRQEVGPQHIRICMIAPGPTKTEVAQGISDPAQRAAIHAYLYQEGSLEPHDVADAIVYVVSAPPRVNISELWIRATTDVAY